MSQIYSLPDPVRELLASRIPPGLVRTAAAAVMRFVGRYQASAQKLLNDKPFVLDRRALADDPRLGLSEWHFRKAVVLLVEIGLLDREAVRGSAYRWRPGEDQGASKKPILYRLSREVRALFWRAARKAIRALRGAARAASARLLSHKDHVSGSQVHMGEASARRSEPVVKSEPVAKTVEGLAFMRAVLDRVGTRQKGAADE